MKFTVFILMALLTFDSNGQSRSVMLSDKNSWNVLGFHLDSAQQFPYIIDRFQFYLFGDTMVSSNLYRRIYYNSTRFYLATSDTVTIDSHKYVGGFRESGPQIYFLPGDSLNERLVYDFSLSVGDTAQFGYFPAPGWRKYIYDSTIITLMDNSQRIKYSYQELDASGSIKRWGRYVQGIGDLLSLVDTRFFISGSYSGGITLYSYCEQGTLLYKHDVLTVTAANDCSFPQGIYQSDLAIDELQVFPNPAGDVVNITIKHEKFFGDIGVEVMDLHGRVMLSTHHTGTGEVLHLDLSGLAGGLYIVLVEFNDSHKQALKVSKTD